MGIYMLCAEGNHPAHGNMRGPVEPRLDRRKKGKKYGGHLAQGAQWSVVHDAGSAFVVMVSGPYAWEEDYILPMDGAYASRDWDEFVNNIRNAKEDDVLAAAVWPGLNPEDPTTLRKGFRNG